MPAQSASVESGPPATTMSMISAVTTGSSQSGVSFSAKKPTAASTRRRCRSRRRNTERTGCRPSIARSIWESVCPVIPPLCRRSGSLATLGRCRSILAASRSTPQQPPPWPDTDSSIDSSTRPTSTRCTRWIEAENRGFHHGRPRDVDRDYDLVGRLRAPRARRLRPAPRPTRDVPVATVDGWPTGLSVPGGRSVDAWAVSAVTVSPTHRRRGIARALMEGELANARNAGAALAMLTVTEATIYGRYGYAPAAQGRDDHGRPSPGALDRSGCPGPRAVRRRRRPPRGRTRRSPVGPWPARPARSTGGRASSTARSGSSTPTATARALDAHGALRRRARPAAGLRGLPHRARAEPARRSLEFDFLVAATDDAERALWRFLIEQDFVTRRARAPALGRRAAAVAPRGPQRGHPVRRRRPPLGARPRSGRGARRPPLRHAPAPSSSTSPTRCGHARGRFRLTVDERGRAEVERHRGDGCRGIRPVARSSACRSSARSTSAACGPRCSAGPARIAERRPRSLVLADRMFAAERTPAPQHLVLTRRLRSRPTPESASRRSRRSPQSGGSVRALPRVPPESADHCLLTGQ